MFKEIEPGVYEFQYGRWTMDQPRVVVHAGGDIRLAGEWPDMAPNQARALAVLLLELTRDKAAGTWAEISAKYGGIAARQWARQLWNTKLYLTWT